LRRKDNFVNKGRNGRPPLKPVRTIEKYLLRPDVFRPAERVSGAAFFPRPKVMLFLLSEVYFFRSAGPRSAGLGKKLSHGAYIDDGVTALRGPGEEAIFSSPASLKLI